MPSVFAGRQEQLEALTEAFDRAAAGRPRVVLVHGAVGTGKSWLVTRFLRTLQGPPVIAVAAAEAEAALPYAVVHQLAVGALAWRPPAGVPDGAAAVLADLQPERLPADAAPLAVGAGLRALFAALCHRCPAIVVIEDMHWSDPVSASALLFACRRLATDRLTVLVSAVPEWPQPGTGWARFIDGDHRASAIRLDSIDAGLTAQELRVAMLIASGLSNRQAAARLFLSQKTVEFHLGNAYAKLGVRTRNQLTLLIRGVG
jgi:DNA-binding CsgD family transcriptional regulator